MRSFKGHLLIAAPDLDTPFFSKTVIFMLSHDETGAMGLVLNRPTDLTVSDIAQDAFQAAINWEKIVHLGGPVPGPLMMIHTNSELADDTVIPGIVTTMGVESLEALIRQNTEPSLVVANYAGWGPGQLEGEFGWASWLTIPAKIEYVLWDDAEGDLWEHVVNAAKSQNTTLAGFLGVKEVPPDPRWN